MTRRFTSAFMICLFAMTVTVPTWAAAAADDHDADALHHEDGAPCPDGDSEAPCDGACPCLCCPGHTSVLYTALATPVVAPPLTTSHHVEFTEIAPPDGVSHKVFRPPQA